MGRHGDSIDVSSGAFETVGEAIVTVRDIVDNMWVVAAACTATEEANDALLEAVKYLRIIIHNTEEGDPELVAYGLMEFLHEIENAAGEAVPRRPAGWKEHFRTRPAGS